MKKKILGFLGAVIGVMIPIATVCGQAAATPPAAAPAEMPRFSPDLAEVVKMVQSNKSQDEMITQVKTCPRMYNLSATDAVNLDKFGVPPKVVLAIVEHDRVLQTEIFKPAPGPETPAASHEAAGQGGAKPAKYVKPVSDSVVSRPKGTPPPTDPKPKRVWTSSIIVEKAPPAPKLELVPKSPGHDFIWIRGHWSWKTGAWTWEEGYWSQRPGPDIQWMDGEWARHGKGWIWIPGHWR